jgi:hypothetical protein
MHGTLEIIRPERKEWSQEMEAWLRRLAEEGMSAKDAGVVMGLTKNAVIGKAFRSGIKFQSAIKTNKPKPSVERRVSVRRVRTAPLPAMEPEPDALMLTVNRYVEGGKGVLKNKSCRWIVTNDHPMLYCGHDKAQGDYCAHHWHKMYQPPQARIREPRPR